MVMPYLRHYGAFVPKIRERSGLFARYSKRDGLSINHLLLVVFLEKKFSRAESCAEDCIPQIFVTMFGSMYLKLFL